MELKVPFSILNGIASTIQFASSSWHFRHVDSGVGDESLIKMLMFMGKCRALRILGCKSEWLDFRWWYWLIHPFSLVVCLTSTWEMALRYGKRRQTSYREATRQSDRKPRQASAYSSHHEPDPMCQFSWSLPSTARWCRDGSVSAFPPRLTQFLRRFLYQFSVDEKEKERREKRKISKSTITKCHESFSKNWKSHFVLIEIFRFRA